MREQLEKHPQYSGLRRLNLWLIIITVGMTLLYAAFWLWQALKVGQSTSRNMDSILGVNPRPMIVLCLVATALLMLFLPEIGKLLAALSLAGAVFFFGYWWSLTAGIKSNLGVDKIKGADWLGNLLIGANPVDVIVAAIALLLIGFDLYVLKRNVSVRFNSRKSIPLVTPISAHK